MIVRWLIAAIVAVAVALICRALGIVGWWFTLVIVVLAVLGARFLLPRGPDEA